MANVLLINNDPTCRGTLSDSLQCAGHRVWSATCGSAGLQLLARQPIHLAIAHSHLPDMPGLNVLQTLRASGSALPFIITGTGTIKDAVTAVRCGATDVFEEPTDGELLLAVERALPSDDEPRGTWDDEQRAHAAARVAGALIRILDSPEDPRTIQAWARCAFASPGALRNWCRTAGLRPRQSLVFGRMLRAVIRGKAGCHKPENLLAVVDRRTLFGLFRYAGFDMQNDLPPTVEEFLRQQVLIRDPDALLEIRRALSERETGGARITPMPRSA
jgi:CheY-like chemotaxis protein